MLGSEYCLAEREGFEPSDPRKEVAFLAGMWFKPNSPTSPSVSILPKKALGHNWLHCRSALGRLGVHFVQEHDFPEEILVTVPGQEF